MPSHSLNLRSDGDAEVAKTSDPPQTIIIVSDNAALSGLEYALVEFHNSEIKSIGPDFFHASDHVSCSGCILLDSAPDPTKCLSVLEDLKPLADRIAVIVLADSASIRLAVNAMRTGAFDVLEKPVSGSELQSSVREALDSVRSIAPAERTFSSTVSRGAARHAVESLTLRQRDILRRIMRGQPNKIIAADLGISQRTAENHRAAIMRKLGVSSISALVQLTVAAS